jgi:mono/diheme cytochrome c family protein
MPQLGLSDDVIANILTYVRNSWGNQSEMISTSDVAKLRAKDKK